MRYRFPFVLLILAVVGLIAFWPTFQLEIYGDEWEGIWWTTSTWLKTGHFNDRIGYKSYELAAILLNFVSGGFGLGYSSTQVYFFSFLTRLFAVFCLYYFLTRRRLSKVAVFIGCLLFLITPIGIQTTDWAKNFTSYISIGFLLLCMDSIFALTGWNNFIIFLTTFSLSVFVNPIRSHGIIFTVIFLLTLQLFFQKKYKKLLSLSLAGVLLVSFLFSKFSVFGDVSVIKSSYASSFSLFFNQINLTKIGDLFILVGRGILPNPSAVTIFVLVIILFYWKRNLFRPIVFIPVIFSVAVLFMSGTMSNEKITALMGTFFLVLTTLALFMEIFNKKRAESMETIVPLLLSVSFVLLPYFLGRTDVTDFRHRYLIYSALSVPIIVAFSLRDLDMKSIFSLKLKSGFFYVCLVILVLFFTSLRTEVDNLYKRHNQIVAQAIWDQIRPYFNDFDFRNRKAIVYFDSNDEGVLHDVVSFGFGYRMGFIYGIWDYDSLPVAVDSKKDLISLITDGKAAQKYVQKDIIFPKEDAFYFRIEGTKVVKLPI